MIAIVNTQGHYEYKRLIKEVHVKRGELYDLAEKNEWSSKIVVTCSQELDALLNLLQDVKEDIDVQKNPDYRR